MKGFGHSLAIDTVDHVREIDGVSALIRLKVADEFPSEVARALPSFELELLDFVLPKEGQSGISGLTDARNRMPFADSNELHLLWISAGTITGCGDPLLDRLEILDDAHPLDLTDRQKL
jgi:hypothetical protein